MLPSNYLHLCPVLVLTLYSLRADSDLLANVKEQLFKLWGNLEELKSAQAPEAAKQAKNTSPPPFRKELSSPLPRRKPSDQPDLDSDSESENERKSNKLLGNSKGSVLKERSSNITTTVNPISIADTGIGEKPSVKLSPNNKVFTCCIQQYGVKVDEGDASKANAGNGKRWQRVFGLVGTQIL
jgi:protection-of-telomeres protein 1